MCDLTTTEKLDSGENATRRTSLMRSVARVGRRAGGRVDEERQAQVVRADVCGGRAGTVQAR